MYAGRILVAGIIAWVLLSAAEFRVPGVDYPAMIREELSILPGGRAVRPFGRQVLVGTGPFAIAVSASGKTIVTANLGISTAIGIDRASMTVIKPEHREGVAWSLTDFAAEPPQSKGQAWQGVSAGLVLVNDGSAWVAEGDSGRVVELSTSSGSRKAAVNLNAGDYANSFTEALAYDAGRGLLMVLDQANDRVAVVETKRSLVIGSVKLGKLPVAVALSADGKRGYVAGVGSLWIVDLANPAEPKMVAEVELESQDSPGGVAVNGDEVYVSLQHEDAIAAINAASGKLDGKIPLRIAGLEDYRGVTPLGLCYDPKSKRLLAAEAGINAVAVVDGAARKVLGHLPAGWFPTALAVHDGQVYVAAARGWGTGPSTPAHRIRMWGGPGRARTYDIDSSVLRRGIVSAFAVPDEKELAHQTDVVMQANGFSTPKPQAAALDKTLPTVKHVVLIVKGDRAFDEILGDVPRAGDKIVLSEPSYARFGLDGYVSGGKKRFSLHVPVTPNHHALAERWAFADNYYVDSSYAAGGYRWLMGGYPDRWTELGLLYGEAGNQQPVEVRKMANAGKLWDHLKNHDLECRVFDSEDEQETRSDQQRADAFMDAVRKEYIEGGKALPAVVMLRLPGDTAGSPQPDKGYPYEATYVADNDYALGRVVEFLSKSPWWKDMAIFVTESGAEGGADHVDSHRTVLLGAGPWFRSNYVSHHNASAPALLRTIFLLLKAPSMNLYDATASDLTDMMGAVPDFSGYDAKLEDARLFEADKLK